MEGKRNRGENASTQNVHEKVFDENCQHDMVQIESIVEVQDNETSCYNEKMIDELWCWKNELAINAGQGVTW